MEAVNLTSVNYNQYVMQEVGRIIASEPETIIDLLESNDYLVDPSISAVELGDAYLYELPNSDGLKLGTAYLVATKSSNFSGEIENEEVYSTFDAISDYWEDFDDEETSNVAGALIGGIVQGGLGVTERVLDAQNKKKYGALDLAQKQAESRQALISGIIAQKQAQAQAEQKKAEEQAKQKRILTISVASVVGIVVLVGAYMLLKNKRNG
jgi:F0F1-type ATP synthase membrane subunit c/vacuolar-type H+-ATPase subunit K